MEALCVVPCLLTQVEQAALVSVGGAVGGGGGGAVRGAVGMCSNLNLAGSLCAQDKMTDTAPQCPYNTPH